MYIYINNITKLYTNNNKNTYPTVVEQLKNSNEPGFLLIKIHCVMVKYMLFY